MGTEDLLREDSGPTRHTFLLGRVPKILGSAGYGKADQIAVLYGRHILGVESDYDGFGPGLERAVSEPGNRRDDYETFWDEVSWVYDAFEPHRDDLAGSEADYLVYSMLEQSRSPVLEELEERLEDRTEEKVARATL